MYARAKNVFIDDLIASMGDIGFKLEDFDFNLPEEYIARTPRAKRSGARLMHLNKQTGKVTHSGFSQFEDFINEGDLLIFNDTRIIPSRLKAKTSTGKEIEVYVERVFNDQHMLARIFKQPQLGVGDLLTIANQQLIIIDINAEFYDLELCENDTSFWIPDRSLHSRPGRQQGVTLWNLIHDQGELAFPLYFQRNPTELDKQLFQTIYAKKEGSVSAPSAGFHFDQETFDKLNKKNISIGFVTLHVGSGTSAPIHVDDISKHKMHTEWLDVSPELCELIRATKARGKRVIAVGTTSLRALETASQGGQIQPYQGYTDIFIRPGHQFNCIDGLFTNLHLPRSTLMILISALAGYQNIKEAYKLAIADNYRFLAYGDGMLIT